MIILTGGAGFIGSALLSFLNAAGQKDIVVVDNLRSSEKWKNLVGKSFHDYWPREKLLEEVRNNNLPASLQAIIHLGACSSTLEKNVDFLIQNNYQYSVELARYCLNNDKRFIYASSGATYGDGLLGFSDSCDISKLRPLNPYGFSKQLFDLWAEFNGVLEKAVGVKFFNVFGPNEYHKGPMQSMVLKGYEQIRDTGKIKLYKSSTSVYNDGGQLRDFIYIKDCCKVLLWFLENSQVTGLFNLGTGIARSWNALGQAIFSASRIEPNFEYIEMPLELSRQYQNFTQADTAKLHEAGYKSEFLALEESVTDYVSKYLVEGYSTV